MYRANQQPLLAIRGEHDLVACAILTATDANLKPMTLLRWLWNVSREAGVRSVWRTMAHMRHIEPYQPSAPHYRLEFIAVHPAHQGQGYGRLLLDEIH
jgi:GNAT superfamily N-acetyltransferase